MADLPTTITLTPDAETALRLRLLLPPNLQTTAPRDAIPVKVELEPEGRKPLPPERISRDQRFRMSEGEAEALALIEDWCGGKPAAFMQLSREKLRRLVSVLSEVPAFFLVNRPGSPIAWEDSETLVGVSEYLAEPAEEQAATPEITPQPAAAPEKKRPVTNGTPMTVDGSEHYLAIGLPSREHPLYREAVELLKSRGFILEPSNRKWWLRDRHKTLVFLSEYLGELRNRFGATFTSNFTQNLGKMIEAGVAGGTVESADGYELELRIEAKGVDRREIEESLREGRPYLERGGRVVLIPKRKLEELDEARRLLSGNGAGRNRGHVAARSIHRISGAELAVAGSVLDSLLPGFQPPSAWRERAEALGNISKLTPPPLPEEVDQQLRLYQKIGVAWMLHLYRHGLAGILADEMGLGKTLQALCLIEAVRRSGRSRPSAGPALVVCPASLVENWRREAEKFLPGMRTFLHYRQNRVAAPDGFSAFDLVITSYSTLVRDQEIFSGLTWGCIVADEAQHIKNRRTQTFPALASLRSRGRYVLTGTPVENSLNDLVSLFAFLMPGYLTDVPSEARGEERAWHEERVRKRAAPYILRRTKAWVAPELPEKIEQTLFCDMEPPQRDLYERFASEARNEMLAMESQGESDGAIRNALLVRLLRLRQICTDPRLVDQEAAAADSGKLQAFREVLAAAIDDGHRLLVFSQFVRVLRLLASELEEQGLLYSYLDGQTRDRLAVCDRFNRDSSIPVFLISLKAGGTGLNLTGADTVIHFDPWWNPAVEMQATDRAHRIGQTRVVTSIKLIAAHSIEEKVLKLQHAKRVLLTDLFEESDAASSSITLADLKELLE